MKFENQNLNIEEGIVKFCGEYPEGFKNIEIESDPSFVFEKDDSFENVTLYDEEGNTVTVNSFLECHHYVNGGWDYNPIQSSEQYYINVLGLVTLCLATVIIISTIRKKIS